MLCWEALIIIFREVSRQQIQTQTFCLIYHFFFQIYLTNRDLQMMIFNIHDDVGHSITAFHSSILDMLWIILLLIILLLVWVLLSPLEFKVDTRVPVIMAQWKSIGNALFYYEDEEWWLNIRVLFFSKKWNVAQMIFADRREKKKSTQRHRKKGGRKSISIFKFFKIIKTFQIVQWKIALSAEDNAKNARWYWLNFFPLTRGHVHVNFFDENYLVLIIKNRVWRMAYAFIR